MDEIKANKDFIFIDAIGRKWKAYITNNNAQNRDEYKLYKLKEIN